MKNKLLPALMRCALAGMILHLGFGHAAHAAEAACPFPGQTRMLQVQMFFGQEADGQPITEGEWRAFLESDATPRFPLGLTVYDGYGQWLDPQTHAIARENAKILQIVEVDSAAVRKKVEDLSRIYRDKFHQKAVGILTNPSCAVF